MNSFVLLFLGKFLSAVSKFLNLGNGSTWPGHLALLLNKHFIRNMLAKSKTKIILIAGTNGKTTTAKLIKTVLVDAGKTVLQNQSGANLLNGIASSLILNASFKGKIDADFAIFEVDENALSLLLNEIRPEYIILLNLFRDQLDRYGEVHTIAAKWDESLKHLTANTKLILNADDPTIAYIGHAKHSIILYFGLSNSAKGISDQSYQSVDSTYCPRCAKKLSYAWVSYSHLGDWQCTACKLARPKQVMNEFPFYPLSGIYNKYNTLAAVSFLKQLDTDNETIASSFKHFQPAFGRQETIEYKGKRVQLFLSKNPTSFNQSYDTIKSLKANSLLLVLNDRIPDGRDVSWIWDIAFESLHKFNHIFISGDRVYDMALRVKYTIEEKTYLERVLVFENLEQAIEEAVSALSKDETLFILPTYSAMLEVRKILTGKRIL